MSPKKSPSYIADQDALLRHIVQGTASETGERFFRALVKNFSQALGTHAAWVTEYLPRTRRLRALAFWLGNGFIEDYEYAVAGTPCEPAIQNKSCLHIAENVVELFPEDADLRKLGAASYMGCPLLDSENTVLGNLAVLDLKPMPDSARNLALFRIFAARATAELLRVQGEADVREREEKIKGLFNGVMDAIVELDSDLAICVLNPAAERLLDAPASQIVGKTFTTYLSSKEMHRFCRLVQDLTSRPRYEQKIWIPEGLTVRTANGKTLPTEATVTLFEANGECRYALILRDINERFESRRLIASLRQQTLYLRDEIQALTEFGAIIGNSPAFRKTLQLASEVAPTDATVLLCGDTGTGKELMARTIHATGRRKDRPMITVNCAAIPESLMESEFFGHEKGAFTGATRRREGRFALADGGTIFLDEVSELNKEMQAKLLRVLQEGEFSAVGSSTTRKVDVRVIAATNRDLSHAVRDGRFRTDLYFRLSVFPITLPPLRARGDDIGLLASHLVRKIAGRMGRTIDPLTPDLIARLKAYAWPGNVRELQNVIERGVITARYGRLNLDHALPAEDALADVSGQTAQESTAVRTIHEFQQMEKKNLLLAMQTAQWRISGKNGAAHLLGVPASTLQSKLKTLGIKRPAPPAVKV
ncbi:MAG: hypothetical protein VR64_02385 [Desulfatitalea sp. BRH_c12]|nr:MAG: hypothetical protein VR64_02385 [Desulfatitalea sp. BRH_c12]